MLSNLTFKVNENIAIKDPINSELGRRILSAGIDMIDELGLENFNFRKLAKSIGSTEASVYRYFENKHKLLLYLVNWYWGWLENKILVSTQSQRDSYKKLETVISILTSPIEVDDSIDYIDAHKLHQVIISEGSKSYRIKEVDIENVQGVFLSYKGLCEIIANFILALNPKYQYAHSLASTIVETCHNQLYFSEHLPRLTEIKRDDYDMLKNFVLHLTASAIH